MFEKVILSIIEGLESVVRKLTNTYYETYGDSELAEEFADEVRYRQKVNKKNFIQSTTNSIINKILKEQGYLITPNRAEQMAEILFEDAKNKGKIDFMNNCIE